MESGPIKYFWFIFTLSLFSLAREVPNPENFYGPLPLAERDYVVEHQIQQSEGLDYAQLKQFIQTHAIRSIQELFTAIKEQKPAWETLLESASLVYDSQGEWKQYASWDTPIVILHKDNVLLELVSKGNTAASEQINLIELDKAAKFQFKQIHFKNSKPSFNENPASCTSCHGSGENARPIWGSHRLWAGVYGGFNDKLPATSKERLKFIQFMRSENKRLSGLYFPGFDSSFLESTPQTGGILLKHRPNRGLNDHIHAMNDRRIEAILSSQLDMNQWGPAFLGAKQNCQNFPEEFFNDSDLRSMQRKLGKNYIELLVDTKTALNHEFFKRVDSYNRLARVNLEIDASHASEEHHFSYDLYSAASITKFRMILESNGIGTRRMAPLTGYQQSSFTFASSTGVLDTLSELITKKTPDLQGIMDTKDKKLQCAQLAMKTKAAFKNAIATKKQPRKPSSDVMQSGS